MEMMMMMKMMMIEMMIIKQSTDQGLPPGQERIVTTSYDDDYEDG